MKLRLFGVNFLPFSQVLIQVPQKSSVITWDFDILKGSVTFTIYRSREQLAALRHEHHVPGAVGGIGSQQYISKRMSVGVDLVVCCQPCICRDGDSIQVFFLYNYFNTLCNLHNVSPL